MIYRYQNWRARMLVRALFHVKPSFDVPLHDIFVAHGPTRRVIAAGFAAGVLVVLIPVSIFLLISTFLSLMGAIFSGLLHAVGYGVVASLSTLASSLPFAALVGFAGAGLAYLRRRSIVRARFVHAFGMRLGLGTLLMSTVGSLALLWIAPFLLFAGPVFFLVGFILDGLWEVVHDALLDRWLNSEKDVLLSSAARALITNRPTLAGFTLHDVRVQNGRALVRGSWSDSRLRQDVTDSLRWIEGISTVAFESAIAPPDPSSGVLGVDQEFA